MKKIEELVVPENVDIVEKIIRLAEESKSWFYISDGLILRLKKLYLYRPYESNLNGIEFCIHGDNFSYDFFSENKLSVEFGNCWNTVCSIPKRDVSIASDPEIVYFLS